MFSAFRSIRCLTLSTFIVAAMFSSGIAQAQSKIVAIVNDQPITSYELTQRTKLLKLTSRNGSRKKALDELIEEKLKVLAKNNPGIFKLFSIGKTEENRDLWVMKVSDNVEVDGGADFIERNAMLLVELIGIINAQKTPGVDQNVVIGPSMGGLISRYALNFMEREGLDHDTRLWISFDSPHNGANVPIGFQYLFNKLAYGLQLGGLAGDQSIEAVQPLVDGMLKSPAARQMLVDQFEAHITSGTDFDSSLMLPQKHGWSDLFYNALKQDFTTSGFPETTRNVSIINGSGIGSTYPDVNGAAILPDFQSLDLQDLSVLDLGFFASADVNITSRFTPYLGQANTVGTIEVVSGGLCFCGFNASATVQAESFSDGVDAGSGGLFDIAGLAADFAGDPLIDSFLAAMKTDSFNFIPTVSAMALENDGEIDWFHVPNNLATSRTVENTTPFEAWHMPDNNEPHVTLTQPNVDFALAEILQNTLSTPSILSDEIKLEQNPVSNNLTLLSTKQFDQTEISIIDITGKTVYSNTTTLHERTNIPLNLASGLYILNINTQDNYSLKTKVIIK